MPSEPILEAQSLPGHAQSLGHLFIQESSARPIRLHPLAVDHKLRNRPLADIPYQFCGSTRRRLNVNLPISNVVSLQKALGFPAVAAPRRGVEEQLHPTILDGYTLTR